ncbi:MAG: amidohydrolase family protein [Acidimicrobiales bacterium]
MNSTPIIDVQVHAYERDHPERPWRAVLHGPPEVTGDDMVAAMDRVGVDGALLVSPWTMYRYDASYACEVYEAHPGRFGLIKPIDTSRPDAADVIGDWAATPGAVGARIMMVGVTGGQGGNIDPDSPGVNAVLAAAADVGLPINVLCWGAAPMMAELARKHPNTQLIVDHLGLAQPFEPPAPPEPWAALDEVLALAALDNIAVKVSGACTLSHEPFPYLDIWDPLSRMFEAFGFDRLLWGTDWTRAVELLTYQQGVEAFTLTDRLTTGERAALMGGTLMSIYDWAPDPLGSGDQPSC